ncbi:hypothetical protein TWF106_002707 [Orbilia oligospora]|uniref:Uncharacterized protein n=1 Tax=Orbilia oligospora TaxID=2813651 RepID=A0A7C8U6H2_ORBOL|nr:hypothetical protein TWF106_002707 [Orbilia oligospora]
MHPSTVTMEDSTTAPDPRPAPTSGCLAECAAAVAPATPLAVASGRWSDYEDEDDDWVPEILLPKPADTQLPPQQVEEEDPEEEEEIPDDGIWYDERVGQYMYGGEPISYINGDLVTPQEWVHSQYFEGYWQDKVTKRVHLYCQNQLALAVHSDGRTRWLNGNYYWARHPMTMPMSKYELLTLEFNSVAANPTRRGGSSMGKTEWARGAATRALRIPVVAPCDTPPTEEPAPPVVVPEADDSIPSAAGGGEEQVEEETSEEISLADSEVVDVCVALHDVAGPSEPVTTSPAPPQTHTTTTTAPAEVPSPRPPERPVLMTPLEFLISRGLHHPAPPRRRVFEGPVKPRLQDFRPSWASKLRSPVRSLTTAYRKAGDKIANKFAVFLGAW